MLRRESTAAAAHDESVLVEILDEDRCGLPLGFACRNMSDIVN